MTPSHRARAQGYLALAVVQLVQRAATAVGRGWDAVADRFRMARRVSDVS